MPYTSVGPLHTSYLLCTTFLKVKIVNPMLFMEKSKDQHPGSEHLSRHTGSEGRGKPGTRPIPLVSRSLAGEGLW